jgi:hypothetical protein
MFIIVTVTVVDSLFSSWAPPERVNSSTTFCDQEDCIGVAAALLKEG